MSKLSRRRQPQAKLPAPTIKSDDDDDFVTKPPAPTSLNIYKNMTEVKEPNQAELKIMRDTNVILFEEIEPNLTSTKNRNKLKDDRRDTNPTKNGIPPETLKLVETRNHTIKPEETISNEATELNPEPFNPEVQEDREQKSKDKVVCPFCWKKLNDKLTGTSHVKNCGKNLPTERIFEALQLHEKQIREWEYLGIDYPGFQQNPIKVAASKTTRPANTATAAGTSRPNRRKKKDPELDLAIALSASLHEEIEDRKRKEKEYLLEIGLEKEIVEEEPEPDSDKHVKAIAEAKSKFRIRFGKEAKVKLPKSLPVPTQAGGSGRSGNTGAVSPKRRGKTVKTNLVETPLYTTTEVERQDIINRRAAEILENSEKENELRKEQVRINEYTLNGDMNERLKIYNDEDCTLWKLASSEDQPKDKFCTPALKESKHRHNQTVKDPKPQVSTPLTVEPSRKFEDNLELSGGFEKRGESGCGRGAIQTLQIETCGAKKNETTKKDFLPVTPRLTEQFSFLDDDTETPKVAQDLLRLLVQKVDSDLTIYGLEERPIRAHKLILTARCPNLLKDIVVEELTNGKSREIIALTDFLHASVKSFVWFLYSGKFLPLSTSAEDRKVEEQIKELCRMYSLQVPEIGSTKSNRQFNEKSKIKVSHCKYVEKAVQTDIAENSPLLPSPVEFSTPLRINVTESRFNRKSMRETDLFRSIMASKNGATNIFTDSGDALLELCETKSNSNSVKINCDVEMQTNTSDNIIEQFDGGDGNISNDGSCDLFGEYYPEEGKEKNEDEGTIVVGSFKKRSRSLSPSLEGSFSNNSSCVQATKRHKLDSVTTSESENVPEIPPKDPSLVTLDDTPENFDIPDMSDSHCSDLFKNVPITEDFSQKRLGSGFSRLSSQFQRCLQNEPLSYSPASRNSVKIGHANKSILSIRFTTIQDSFERFRTSFAFSPRPSLFSPVKTVDNVDLCPSPFPQENDNRFDNWDQDDDSILTRIPDNFLEVPNNPNPDSKDNTFSPEEVIPQSKPTRMGRSKEKGGGDATEKDRQKSKDKGKKSKAVTISASQGTSRGNFETDNNTSTPSYAGRSQPIRTPLLNYSTIDTPILKSELKKYGLKPLPRSKAKVLLRHIYTETHK